MEPRLRCGVALHSRLQGEGRGCSGEGSERLAGEGKGDEGFAGEGSGLFGLIGERGFERGAFGMRVEVDGAGRDNVVGGAVEAELADTESVFGGEGWAEGAAGERSRGIEVAEAGGGIEDGTGLVIGEGVECLGASGIDEAGVRVAGKSGGEPGDGLPDTDAEPGGAGGIVEVEGSEAGAETGGVELRDGEDADAALGASGSAEEMGAGAAGSVGNGSVDDLDKLGVARGEHELRVAESGAAMKNSSWADGILRERRGWCDEETL
jgi:hypothetical protein